MYWAVAAQGADSASMFPSYPLALKELDKLRGTAIRYDWRLYSLSDITPLGDDLLTKVYEEER